jgi:hypothetical protein
MVSLHTTIVVQKLTHSIDDESMPTVRCPICSSWHHRPCVNFVENEEFTCPRCIGTPSNDVPDNASTRSGRSVVFPPGFDLNELSNYEHSGEPVRRHSSITSHFYSFLFQQPIQIGLLWYLNVHASLPYRWQRCQALLYPHKLLLSWLAPGGGRGIVVLDLFHLTSVQSAPSPTHPSARDDVGTSAARQQSSEPDSPPLMDMLVPFHMLYPDGVERLASESLLERQIWVNRFWLVTFIFSSLVYGLLIIFVS